MINFLEGLPRSGKSYSAVKDYVIPLLKEGRKIFANIHGLNHPYIAELAGITEEQCRALLIEMPDEHMPQVWRHVENDSFVIIDEAQDYYGLRWRPDAEMTKFVTQHGHRGLDILLMGQSFKDVHNLWRRRTETKFFFEKRSGFGKANSYKVITFRAVSAGNDVKFEKIKTERHDYDESMFGTYKSHTDETKNKETFVDQRTVIWNHPFFKRWLVPCCLLLTFAIGYIVWGFNGGFAQSMAKDDKKPEKPATQVAQQQPRPVAAPMPPKPKEDEPKASDPLPLPIDPVGELSSQYRLRYAGFARQGKRSIVLIEWRGNDDQLMQSMTSNDLLAYGWVVFHNDAGSMAILQNGNKRLVAMPWNLRQTNVGRVSEDRLDEIAGGPQNRYRLDDYGNALPAYDRRMNGTSGTSVGSEGAPPWNLKEPVLPADKQPQQTAQASN